MKGEYLDCIQSGTGRAPLAAGWSANTIVEGAWPLVAGLLKNDAAMAGILYWAVGAGDPAWDGAAQPPNPDATRLHQEMARQAVPPAAIVYLNADGTPSADPTACIEISIVFAWPEAHQLREFGLFGGQATATADSGRLINYVIHPRIDLAAGANLARRVRFTLKPESGPEWQALPNHWLGEEPARRIDGVGRAFAEALGQAGIVTIRDLSMAEPLDLQIHLPLMRAVELRAKARMALRTAAGIRPLADFSERTPWEVLTTPVQTLLTDSGATPTQIGRLVEQAGALQLTLDNTYLRRLTLGRLAQATG
ncbi:MAG: hypothetical protein WAU91_11880 [Desulfatitalea sp.]